MAYTTADNVRKESGFEGNSNITDATITIYLNEANGIVQGMVAGAYVVNELAASATFTGSQAEYYLKRAETLIASGLLLIKEYGAEQFDSDKNGYDKYNEGKALLEMILRNEAPVRLIDTNGDEFTRVDKSTAGGVVGGISSTSTAKFTVDDIY